MSQSSKSILDQIADFLKFISKTQSFWFTLNTSYNHGCHLTNPFRLDPDKYEVVLPLVAPPWCRLIVPAGCRIVSYRPLIAPPSCHLVAPAVVASPLTVLSLHCPHVLLLCQLVVALPLAILSLRHPLVNSLHQLVVA